MLFDTTGAACNSAIQKYVNQKQVPHLFLGAGSDKFGDYQHYPWTMGFQPSYRTLELYRTIGIDQRIVAAEPKEARPTDIATVESLGGPVRCRWSVPASRDLGELSPCRSVFIKQRNLEEIVRDRAMRSGMCSRARYNLRWPDPAYSRLAAGILVNGVDCPRARTVVA